MRILLDTNILVHAYNIDSPFNKRATEILTDALNEEINASIALQSIHEFFSVITSSRRVQKPVSSRQAAEIANLILKTPKIIKLDQNQETTTEALSLAKKYGITGPTFFDCLLAVTAAQNGVTTIITENVKDFQLFPNIEIVNPFED